MFSLTTLIPGGAGMLLGGAIMYGVMWGHEAFAVAAATKAAEAQGVVVCNDRVAEIERRHNDAVSVAVEAAVKAAREVAPPVTPDAIKAACKASASCRSRGAP